MKQHRFWLAGFVLIKFLLQYIAIHPYYELQRDEYLHLDQANHLAWGYISLPPFTSWIALLIKFLGNGEFWVKFFPALFGALTIILVWKMIESLGGSLYAKCLGAAAVTFSAYVRLNTLFQPNTTDVFFWTLFYYVVLRYVQTEKTKWLYSAGLVAGAGLLSKYNFAFLLLGLLPALLFTSHKKLFTKKAFYAAIMIAFVIVLPNIIWQYKHHFPTIRQLNELTATQLVNMERGLFVKDQFLYFINSFFLILAALSGLFFYKGFRKYMFIGIGYFISIGLYLWLHAKSYYAAGLYPVLIAFGAVYLGIVLAGKGKQWLRLPVMAAVVLLALPLLFLSLPFKKPAAIKSDNQLYKSMGLLRWEDGKDHDIPMDFADMTGWKELASKTDSVYALIRDKEHTLVICDNYGEAGAINYYSRFKNIQAVSFNADYIYWFPLHKKINTVISVKYKSDTSLQKEHALFKTVQKMAEVRNTDAVEGGSMIFLLEEPVTDLMPLIKEEILKRTGN